MNGRQLVGKTLEQAIPEIKGQPFMALLQKVFETGIPFHAPAIEATANFTGSDVPTTKHFNLSYTPYKNNEGTTEGILASGYDITEEIELKKKENKKILNQQSYNLFMQAPVGFSLVRGENHIVELANAAGLRLAGKDKDAVGKSVAELLPGMRSQGYIELLDKVKRDGKTLKLRESPVTFIRNGKENTIYVNLTFQPYYEADKIDGVLNVSIDVTEQVLARRKVEAAEQKARIAIESAELGVYEVNALTGEVNGDKRFFELFGFDEPVTWKELTSLISKEDLPIREKAYEEARINGRLFYEIKVTLKDNTLRWLKISGKAFFNDKKVAEKILGVVEDITEQKLLEQQKDTFLSIASHELKTPVTTIKAYGQLAETLLEKSGETQALAMIKKMGTQVDRLTNLIEDLLDVRKIQAGKLMFTDTDFGIDELVTEVANDMQKTSVTHKIVCNTLEKTTMYGDKDKVSQVLTNFISNAIKYSPKADKIIVSAVKKDDDVLLSVQDFGIGISEKNIENVFEQFYRIKGDNQSTYPGMGIGLYICSEIVKRQGGKIWVESEIGKGSMFYVKLPLDYRKAEIH
jgi:signal transduction histidine kinase